MSKFQHPSPEVLRSIFRYDAKSGKLFFIGSAKPAFDWKTSHGYKYGRFNGKFLYAHRVIYAIVNGIWPEDFIDHIDGDRSNNKWNNLRAATPLQNKVNSKSWAKSKLKGARLEPSGRWGSYINIKGKAKRLGTFDTAEQANAAYLSKANELYGEFSKG